MGDRTMTKLYGGYPYPYESTEHLNGYHLAPRGGPDNVDLIMQGWQGREPSHAFGSRTQASGPHSTYQPSFHGPQQQSYRQLPPEANMPSAGAPTNPNYGVYSYGDGPPSARQQPAANEYNPMPAFSGGPVSARDRAQTTEYTPTAAPMASVRGLSASSGSGQQSPVAAGGYRQVMPGELPRSGRGMFQDSGMHDHVRDGLKGVPAAPTPVVGRGPGSLSAVAHNQDSLSHFMGGMAGASAPRNRENAFDDYYGRAHAGKATVSHLSPMANGLQGPTEPLDAMPHHNSNRAGHKSGLESNPDGGYIPREGQQTKVFSGLRVFSGQPQAQDHLQMSPTGLTADVRASHGGQRMTMMAAAKQTNVGMSDMGLSHQGRESGYPAVHHGPHAAKHTHSVLSHMEGGIIEGGIEPMRRNPHAGKNGASQLTAGVGGLTGAPSNRNYINPHAGKGQASCLTYSSGTMTIVPQVGGPELRKPAPGTGQWSTTYDNNFQQADTYSTVQASNHYAHAHHTDGHPQRF